MEESSLTLDPSASSSSPVFTVGIDLGTSNSALAFAHADQEDFEILEVVQLDGPGLVGRHKTLPSSLYIPHQSELSADETRLPWQSDGDTSCVVGRFARERGTQVPERLVSSAKSWLANTQVDRYAPILPWRSTIEETKRSPMEASRLYLSHLKAAFEYMMSERGTPLDLSQQTVILTVPASFDEVARSLTYEAARGAGLANVVLLEEPLAAFYAWIANTGDDWRKHVAAGDVVLVCDVGGGTTDLSLIAVAEESGNLRLERISVGDHLLLGGDNMDLTLAYSLKARLEAEGHELDHWQLLSLVGASRDAKERLLADESLREMPVAVAGRGSSLFAQTISTTLQREDVERILLDGFLPLSAADEMPSQRRSLGFQELGLSYEADPAISRHLARFLKRSLTNVLSNESLHHLAKARESTSSRDFLMPNKILFNGGVFKAPVLRARVMVLLQSWNDGESVEELTGANLDLAVASGAAAYAKVRQSGKGIRILSGTARSYYIGLESSMPAVPGIEPPVKGLCLVPQGTEEGSEIELPAQQFGLIVGEPVEFRFFSSAVRAGDGIGAMVDNATRELDETSRLSITLPAGEARKGELVPVRLDALVTEVGTLQLYMKQLGTDQKWNLEFNVRQSDEH